MPENKTLDSAAAESGADRPVAPSQPVRERPPPDRTELLTRARAFLTAPHVHLQDSHAKQSFLAEKGLSPSEIDQLLRELPPSVPPRTYPAPPPSNLPNLLIGVTRIFTWLTGTSALALFVYYRYLLPRLAQSYQARLALRKHQSALIARLTQSASALKTAQVGSYKDLPRVIPVYEDPLYAQCHAIDDLLSRTRRSGEESNAPEDIPDITILRCALEELGRTKTDGVSTEELFRHLESMFPWLRGEEGTARQSDLWNQLNTCPLFVSSVPQSDAPTPLIPDHPSRLLWKYVPPPLPSTPPLLASLATLQAAFPCSSKVTPASPPPPTISARQRTLQVLSDFTGYITTQTYTLGLPSIRGINGVSSSGSSVEDDLRREIRALKGIVLNRRSFLPTGAGVPGFTSDLPRASEA